MSKQKHSASSTRWLQEHFDDKYANKARQKGYRSRAYFKIEEIQAKDKIFKPNTTVVDLGSAPGGWSQYVAKIHDGNGHVLACDLLPMDPIFGVSFLQGDFRQDKVLQALLDKLVSIHGRINSVDVVMSDMAPNISGNNTIDQAKAMYLVEIALDMCRQVLMSNGSFVAKIFQGEGFEAYIKSIKELFKMVKIRKPDSSRSRSREVFVVATGYKY